MVDVFGHLTTVDHPFDYAEGAKLFAKYDKIVEVNNSSIKAGRSTYENVVNLLKACKKENVKISTNSDAHYCEEIGEIGAAMSIINEVGYPEDLIVNTNFEYIIDRVNKNHPKAPKINTDI